MPPLEIIVALEIIRGILYVIILLPVIATTNLRGMKLVTYLTLILAEVGAYPGLIMNQSWPAFMRFVHGVEITADSFFQSLVIVRVFSKRKSK
ncbi:MAG: hypothetical protein ACTSSP_02425 [Candidatus Asgardarchaeia archaeon]